MKWLVQQLRFTIFINETWDPLADDIWPQVASSGLEADEIKPREKFRRQAGLFTDKIGLEIQTSLTRVDLFFVPRSEQPTPNDTIGSVADVIPSATAAISNWIEKVSFKTARLAVGTILIQSVADRKGGYKELLTQMHSVKFDVEADVSDFFFQINRATASKVETKLRVNRLVKFSVAEIRQVTISGVAGQPFTQEVGEGQSFCRLELDVNTDPNISDLEKALIKPILEELSDITVDLSAHGEPR